MDVLLQGRRVLVIEDEYLIAQDLANVLESQGAIVVGPVNNVSDALAAIDQEPCDAAVLDINLAGRTDFLVADELLRRRLPFVFATGYDAGIIPAELQTIERFEKPYNTGAIARSLGRLLSRDRSDAGAIMKAEM